MYNLPSYQQVVQGVTTKDFIETLIGIQQSTCKHLGIEHEDLMIDNGLQNFSLLCACRHYVGSKPSKSGVRFPTDKVFVNESFGCQAVDGKLPIPDEWAAMKYEPSTPAPTTEPDWFINEWYVVVGDVQGIPVYNVAVVLQSRQGEMMNVAEAFQILPGPELGYAIHKGDDKEQESYRAMAQNLLFATIKVAELASEDLDFFTEFSANN